MIASLQFNAAGFRIEDFGKGFAHSSIFQAIRQNDNLHFKDRKNSLSRKENSFQPPSFPLIIKGLYFPDALMRQLSLLLASLTLLSLAPVSNGAIAAGGFAIIGYDDIFDSFTLVALDEIAAGQTVYFTDSGWVSGLNVFRGGSPTATNQLEGESMLKMNVTSTISAGTVISSLAGGAAWNWVNFGPIDGSNALNGEFSDLRLNETLSGPYAPPSDQIYIFQASNDANPLGTPTNFVYLLDNPVAANAGFESATDNFTGDIATGLSTSANTAFEHSLDTFHDGAFGLDLTGVAFTSLNSVGGTKEQWLALIADSTNWTTDEPSTAATFNVNIGAAPEPTRVILLTAGLFLASLRRKRHLA